MSNKIFTYLIMFFLCASLLGGSCHDHDDDHYVNRPDQPTGPSSATTSDTVTFQSGDSRCSEGDYVEYRFDFDDGTISGWTTSATADHQYSSTGDFQVFAQARCKSTHERSSWSYYSEINISSKISEDTLTLRGLWFDESGQILAVGDQGRIVDKDKVNRLCDQNFYAISGNQENMYVCGEKGAMYRYGDNVWRKEFVDTEQKFMGITCVENKIFAVGSAGALFVRDKEWKMEKSPVKTDLLAIWADNSQNIFAVGDQGVILNFDGRNWRIMESGTKQKLCTIWGISRDDIWAAGANGTILHFDGLTWKPISGPVAADWQQVTGADRHHIYFAGSNGNLWALILGNWQQQKTDNRESIAAIAIRKNLLHYTTKNSVKKIELE